FNNFTLTQTDASGGIVTTPNSAVFEFDTPVSNVAAFFSPETILLDRDTSEFSKIKNVLTVTGNITREFTPSKNWNINSVVRRSWNIRNPLLAWLFGNYTNYEIPASQTLLNIEE